MDVNMNFDFSVAESMSDVESSDHLLVLAEGRNNKIPGVSNGFGGKVAAVDADYFTGLYDKYIGGEGERTAAHEMGHLFGLRHTKNRLNLMTQGRSEFRGNRINNSQLGSIMSNYNNGRLNLGSNTNARGTPNLGIGYKVMRLSSKRL